MPLLPVAAREAREASRQARTYAWRWVTAGVALGLMAFVTWASRHSRTQGHELFVTISTVAYIYCLLAGVVRTADTIAAEKRENTLGLLFLTDLKGWDILLGKLISSSVNCVFGLLAMLPLLAIPMLMGGVQWNEFIRVVLNLFNTLLYSISWGFLISSLFRQTVVTISLGLISMLVIGLGLMVLSLYARFELHLDWLAKWLFVFTPTHCHVYAFNQWGPPRDWMENFWGALAVNHIVAWINLRLAIYFLPRFWQEVPKNKKTEQWRERFRAWRFGKGRSKARFRTRLLNQNPLFWLANREQVSSMGLMTFLSIILLSAMAIGMSVSRSGGLEIVIGWFIGLVFVHITIAFRVAMAATQRLAEDRRSGALELLLGTEIPVKEILRGQWMALGRQFFGPALIATLAGVFSVWMILQLMVDQIRIGSAWATMVEIMARLFRNGARAEEAMAILTAVSIQLMLALNWIALIWAGMWMGLREKRPGVAMWFVLAMVLLPPWTLLILGVAWADDSGLMRGVPDERIMSVVLGIGWILGLGHLLFISLWARKNLLLRFREAAADRFMSSQGFPWRMVRRLAFRGAALLAALCLIFAGVRWFLNQRGERIWREALARNPGFILESPKNTSPHVPDAQNFARTRLLNSMGAGVARRKEITWDLASVGQELPWSWSQRQRMDLGAIEAGYLARKAISEAGATPANSVLAGLKVFDGELAELRREAELRPVTKFESSQAVIYQIPQFPNIPQFRNMSFFDQHRGIRLIGMTLALRTSARLQLGSATLDDFFLAQRLAEGFKDSPDKLGNYFQMLLDQAQPIYDGLTARSWSPAQLKEIQEFYARLDLWAGFERFQNDYVRERIQELDRMAEIRHGRRHGHASWLARQMPAGSLRERQAAILDWSARELPQIVDTKGRKIDPAALRAGQSSRPELAANVRGNDSWMVNLRMFAYTQAVADQIVVACAVERFRAARSRWPEALEELAPEFLGRIPHDVCGGQPLRYRIDGDPPRYTIYSVGLDGTDNGGARSIIGGSWFFWQDPPNADWVLDSNANDPHRHIPAGRNR